jgi:predicted LPLAT superfamily acyltransferase
MTKHWASIKEAGNLKGLLAMIWIHSHLGKTAFEIVLVPVMAYFFVRRSQARRASKYFLRRVTECYPENFARRCLNCWSYMHFLCFGRSLLDKYLAWVDPPHGIAMNPVEEKTLLDAAGSGQGCLIIGSHYGNLEYARGIAHRQPGLVINVLIYDRHMEKFARLMAQSEPESQMNLIQVTSLNLDLALKLKAKIANGEWLVIAGDRVPVGDNGRVCRAMFFGRKAEFPIGPFVLANLFGCPVYLLHCFRRQDQYLLSMELFEVRIQLPRAARQRAIEALAGKYAQALERQVAKDPLQWFNFFDFWQAQSGSEESA